jgi:hypothetical protein
MKKVLAVKTPVGGIVQIIPREDSETAVGLSWRETILSDAEKRSIAPVPFRRGIHRACHRHPGTGYRDRTSLEGDFRYELLGGGSAEPRSVDQLSLSSEPPNSEPQTPNPELGLHARVTKRLKIRIENLP